MSRQNPTLKPIVKYLVTVWKAVDGYRWQMRPVNGGRIVAASSEAFTRKDTARRNAERSTGCVFLPGGSNAIIDRKSMAKRHRRVGD